MIVLTSPETRLTFPLHTLSRGHSSACLLYLPCVLLSFYRVPQLHVEIFKVAHAWFNVILTMIWLIKTAKNKTSNVMVNVFLFVCLIFFYTFTLLFFFSIIFFLAVTVVCMLVSSWGIKIPFMVIKVCMSFYRSISL